MKSITTVFFILAALRCLSQQNIADVRTLPEGRSVTVSGIVTNGNELGTIRYLQDKTGGLAVYDNKLNNVIRGDSITVKGKINSYNNLFEITNISELTVHSSNHKLPEPKTLTIDEIGEDFEGQLIQIDQVEIENAGGIFSGNANYKFSVGNKTGEIRINVYSSAVGELIPSGEVKMTAICSQYSFFANDVQTGYQLLPRDMNDFIYDTPINITSPVEIKDINRNGFTLFWKTDSESASYIKYGFSNDINSLTELAQGATVSDRDEFYHEVVVSGFEPASVIYAQAFSFFENDTISSPVKAYATQSNSSGEIKVYFNTRVGPDSWNFLTLNKNDFLKSGLNSNERLEDPLLNIGEAMEDTLIAYINRAKESIDFCMYNIINNGLSNVSEALNSAKDRGVLVRVITCGSTSHTGIEELNPEIPVLERPEIQDGGIMHNKFVVFDAKAVNANNCWILTGSTNISYHQIKTDANNMVFIQDQSLAKTYVIEFEEMWGSNALEPNILNAKFGAEKKDNTPHEFLIDGKRTECYFSPSDNTNQHIIDALNTSDNDLEIETMLITRTDLANTISDIQKKGKNVQVITNYSGDNTEAVNSILSSTLTNGKFVFDDTSPGMLHNKFAVIDGFLNISDPQVITGSHNWSYSADTRNDENTLIIHSWDIATIYLRQFTERFTENGGNLFVKAKNINTETVKVFPNPVVSKMSIESSVYKIEEVRITNITGKEVLFKKFPIPENKKQIQLEDFSNGIYLLRIKTNDDNLFVKKIIIAKE